MIGSASSSITGRLLWFTPCLFGVVLFIGCFVETISEPYTNLLDSAIEFEEPFYSFSLFENPPIDEAIGRIRVKGGGNGIEWRFREGNEEGHFAIDDDGMIRTAGIIDYEMHLNYTLIVRAIDDSALSSDVAVHIGVENVDESPLFAEDPYLFTVEEDVSAGVVVGVVVAVDPDVVQLPDIPTIPGLPDIPSIPGLPDIPTIPSGASIVGYTIAEGNDDSLFAIDNLGRITVSGMLDWERQHRHRLTIRAIDSSMLQGEAIAEISVINIDEKAPRFEENPYRFTVSEDAEVGMLVGEVTAIDPDQRGIAGYAITGGNDGDIFDIDNAGAIRVFRPLDYETRSSYSLTIETADIDGRTREGEVIIGIGNIHDVAPRFRAGSYRFEVIEGTPVGTAVRPVSAFDPDGFAIESYNIVNGNEGDAFDIDTAGWLSIAGEIDYEDYPIYTLRIEAVDRGGDRVEVGVEIAVSNIELRGDGSAREDVAIGANVELLLTGVPNLAMETYAVRSIDRLVIDRIVDPHDTVVTREGITPFAFGGNELRIAEALHYNSESRYELTLRGGFDVHYANGVSDTLGLEEVAVVFRVIGVPPSPVTIITARAGMRDGEIELVWINPTNSDLDRIELDWHPADISARPPINHARGATNILTLTGLVGGREYLITVTSVDDGGNRTPVMRTIRTLGSGLDPVVSLQAVAGNGEATLSWINPDLPNITEFLIAVGLSGSGTLTTISKTTETGANANAQQSLTGLSNDLLHRVRVSVIDAHRTNSREVSRWLYPLPSAPDWDDRANVDILIEGGDVEAIAFSPDGALFATTDLIGSDWHINLRRVSDGQVVRAINTFVNSDIRALAFSPDNTLLASDILNDIAIWRVGDGDRLFLLRGSQRISSLAFSPDGSMLVSGDWGNRIQLWRTRDWSSIRTITAHNNDVLSVAFSPDGSMVASGSADRTVKLWRADDGSLGALRTLSGHGDEVHAVAFSPDGATVASGSWDRTVRLWRTNDGSPIRTLTGHTGGVESVAFNPDGATLASGSWDRTVRLWRTNDGSSLPTLTGHGDRVRAIAFSPDGATLASGSWDRTVRLWHRASVLTGHGDDVYSVAVSPDGSTIASASADNTIKLWDADNHSLLHTLTGHGSFDVNSVAFSPDGATVASGSQDDSIKLWRVATGAEIRTLNAHTDDVRSVAFSPDGETVASGSRDSSIRFWQVSNGSLLRTLPNAHAGDVEAVAFSPDGSTLASGGGDKIIRLWRANSDDGSPIRSLSGHSDTVSSLAFSLDGAMVASGSWDNFVKIWRVSDGAFIGHQSGVYSLALDPNGEVVALGSLDDDIRLWRVGDATPFTTLSEHADDVLSLAFTPDGQTLVSGSSDRTVRVWRW